MGFLDIFKSKRQNRLDVPMAPGSMHNNKLPSLPEFPAIRDDVEIFESKKVKMQEKELKVRDSLELEEPIFVEVDMYRAVLDEMAQSDIILKENEEINVRLDDFRMDFDREYSKLQGSLEDIQRKLIFADKKLFR